MGEKVYGICGTNKCRKEVVPKEDIRLLGSAQMNFVLQSNGKLKASVFMPLPSDWSKYDAVYILSATCSYTGSFNKKIPIGALSSDMEGIVELVSDYGGVIDKRGVVCTVITTQEAFTTDDKIEFEALILRHNVS